MCLSAAREASGGDGGTHTGALVYKNTHVPRARRDIHPRALVSVHYRSRLTRCKCSVGYVHHVLRVFMQVTKV